MNQLLRGAFTSPFGLSAATTLAVEMNLFETDDSYILQVPIPGAKPDQLSITVRENVVTIQGTTEIPEPQGARAIYVGTGQGQIREQIQLPGDVNADQGVAAYDNGVLTLTLPKAPSARERTIPMRIGSSGQMAQGQQQGQGQTQSH
jgi:HSP20 family protein